MQEETPEEKKEKEDMIWLSPTSINDYFRCPFYFFKTHIEKVPLKKSIHLVKGTIVHDCLEKWFNVFEENPVERMELLLETEWRNSPGIKQLKMSPEEEAKEKSDTTNIINRFVRNHLDKVNGIILAGKAENLRHAWFLLKPKFREIGLKNEVLKVRGRADRVFKNFDGINTLGDYKTSNRYGIGMTEDCRRQASIYALMYQEQEKDSDPLDFVSIIYLRFGEEPMLEVTPSLIRYARDTILQVRSNTGTKDEKDYPRKMSALCAHCGLNELCDGTEEFCSNLRKERLKKKAKKK